MGNVEQGHSISYEAPHKPIIDLFQVNFDRHKAFPSFLQTKGVEQFLDNDHITYTLPARDKGCLEGKDEVLQEMLNPSNNDFKDYLIHRVA